MIEQVKQSLSINKNHENNANYLQPTSIGEHFFYNYQCFFLVSLFSNRKSPSDRQVVVATITTTDYLRLSRAALLLYFLDFAPDLCVKF